MNNLSEVDFQSVFESVQGLYLILSPDLTIVAVSDAYNQATMTTRKAIVGKPLFEVFPDNPDDYTADGVSNLHASLNTVLKTKAPHIMAVQKYDIRKPDGQFEVRYWSPMNKPVLNTKKEITYIIHKAEDVTEFVRMKEEKSQKDMLSGELTEQLKEMETETFKRSLEIQKINTELEQKIQQLKESEKRFSKIFDSSPVGISIGDSTGRWMQVNESFLNITGYSEEETIGRTSAELDLMDEEERGKLLKELRRKGELKNLEVVFKHKSGEKRTALFSSEQIVVNKELCFITILHDINERKESEDEIKRMNIELEEKIIERTRHLKEANEKIQENIKVLSSQKQQLQDFCNIISHNLRSPLLNISMLVDFITQCKNETERTELSEKLNNATTNLNEVFNELIESLQIKQDSEIKSEKIPLEEYIKKALQGLQGEIDKSQAIIDIAIEEAPVIYFPPKYVTSILHNLISNSLKYQSQERKPIIKIKTKKNNDNIVLSVNDNGLGIDLKKHKDNLFKIRKVFHFHPDAKGFGLFITKSQVEAMGGKIEVESTPGVGSTFFIEFANQPA